MTHRPPLLETTEEPIAAPRQARSIEKRRRLLEAGRILFAEQGYEATSIEDVTSRAGVASGAFYTYFRSKRQLLVVLMRELIARLGDVKLRPPRGKSADTKAVLRAFVAGVFAVDLEYYGVVRAWHEASLTDPELGELRDTIEVWTSARIARLFRSLAKRPGARKGAELAAFARLMDRHFWSLLARASRLAPRELHREITTASDVIFHYLFHDPRGRGAG